MAIKYRLGSRLVAEGAAAHNAADSACALVEILSGEEANAEPRLVQEVFPFVKRRQDTHFSKIEVHADFLYGAFAIPAKKGGSGTHFSYIVFRDSVIFIDDSGFVKKQLQTMGQTIVREKCGLGFFLSDFIDLLISDDLLFLTGVESQLAHMEDEVYEGAPENFSHRVMACRRHVVKFAHYYLQLLDIGNILQRDDLDFFTDYEQQSFDRLVGHIGRLHSETMLLREYCTQVGEVYQSQLDIHQNKIMKILTIVTTIFLPLTLIVGWYGMNFTNMPELRWQYGYPAMILLSAVIVVWCVHICRKKHFF